MNCTECKESREPATIPYVAHEAAMYRMERIIKRQWLTVILLIVLLISSNLAWLHYESQFETIETTTTQEVTQNADSGTNNFIGGDVNGKTEN